ncbi:MAG: flagellar hook-basal body complex protein FliE [Pseudohongiellaceae bacterium]|jgi:flagellar hook-basal body complex protein FliE
MSNMSIDQVLQQMRILSQNNVVPGAERTEASNRPDFGKLLNDSINQVNDLQKQSSEMKVAFETGSKDVDLPEVMVAAQKASVSFEAMTEVRNKLLSAYQEVMNMQV